MDPAAVAVLTVLAATGGLLLRRVADRSSDPRRWRRADEAGIGLAVEVLVLIAVLVLVAGWWALGGAPASSGPRPAPPIEPWQAQLALDGLGLYERTGTEGNRAFGMYVTEILAGDVAETHRVLNLNMGPFNRYELYLWNGVAENLIFNGRPKADDVTEPWNFTGPRVGVSRTFTPEWSYAYALPSLSTTTGTIPLGVDVVLLHEAKGRTIPGADVEFTIGTDRVAGTAWQPIVLTNRTLAPANYTGERSPRIWLSDTGEPPVESTWVWPEDPISGEEKDFVVRTEGWIPNGARMTLTAPPGWSLKVQRPVGWNDAPEGNPLVLIRNGSGPGSVQVRPTVPDSSELLTPHQELRVLLSHGASAAASFVLPVLGVDTGLSQSLVVNVPYPWRLSSPNRVAFAFVNGAPEARNLTSLTLAASEAIVHASPAPRLVIPLENGTSRFVDGSVRDGGAFVDFTLDPPLRVRPIGEAYTIPHPDIPGLLLPAVASGVQSLFLEASSVAEPTGSASTFSLRMGAELAFANRFHWNVTEYREDPRVFHGVVPPASFDVVRGEEAVDGFPWQLPAGETMGTKAFDASSPFLGDVVRGTSSFVVLADPTGALGERLAAHRSALVESSILANRTTVPIGGRVSVDADFSSLLAEVAVLGGTDLQHNTSVIAPAVLGYGVTETIDTPPEAITELLGITKAIPVSTSEGPAVAMAAGDRVFLLDPADGSLAWKTTVGGVVRDLTTWRPPGAASDEIAVAHDAGVSFVRLDGVWEDERENSDGQAFVLQAGSFRGAPALLVGGDEEIRVVRATGETEWRFQSPHLGQVAELSWPTESAVLTRDSRDAPHYVVESRVHGDGAGKLIVHTSNVLRVLAASSRGVGASLLTTSAATLACDDDSCREVLAHPGATLVRHLDVIGDAAPDALVLTPGGHLLVVDGGTRTLDRDIDLLGAGIGSSLGDGGALGPLVQALAASPGAFVGEDLAHLPSRGRANVAVAFSIGASHAAVEIDVQAGTRAWTKATGAPVVEVVESGRLLYLGRSDGTVLAWRFGSGQPADAWSRTPGALYASFRFDYETPLGGFYGTHVVVSTLSWYDPVLRHRQDARLVTTFDVSHPDDPRWERFYQLQLSTFDVYENEGTDAGP